MLAVGSIVWGVQDVPRAIEFWCAALEYARKREPDFDWAILVLRSAPALRSPPSRVNDTAAERRSHHLDQYANGQAAEVSRLLALGAQPVEWVLPEDADYVVLADHDDNRFCVGQA